MELIEVIGNWGFPIGITIYLLLRFEKRLELLTEVISKLLDYVEDRSPHK